ncbi:MAG TPA: type II toxin-antitoxin system PemK/MazF family toxin [Verrucomicrobiae bacterium]|nr:type II toxin-antitoxin system PemK/MazF family toxin [Verrucomicrobiae bacterium]
MKAWDIYSYTPPGFHGPHPVVIVSHPNRVANKPMVSILACSSQRAGRQANPDEVILDMEDGLSWPTLCFCDIIYAVRETDLTHHRGHVTAERRTAIIRTINRSNGWV